MIVVVKSESTAGGAAVRVACDAAGCAAHTADVRAVGRGGSLTRAVDAARRTAEAEAVAGGWLEHMERTRTSSGRRTRQSEWAVQYFCPAHHDRAGTVPSVRPTR